MPKRTPMPGLISRSEAARRLRRTRLAVDGLVAAGELHRVQVGARFLIVQKSVERYIDRLLTIPQGSVEGHQETE